LNNPPQISGTPKQETEKVSCFFYARNPGERRAHSCHARTVKSPSLSGATNNGSVVSAAAYQSGEKLFSEYDQQQKYYPYKPHAI